MKLYYSPGACSLASHIVLHELGLKHETERVDLKTHQTEKGTDFYKINAKGYVPAVALDNGQILTENIAILTYLTDQKPSQEKFDKYQQLEWLAFVSTEIHKPMGSLFGYKNGPEDVVKGIKERIAKRFDYMEKHLAEKEFIYGNFFGPADAYFFTVLGWCPLLNVDLKPWKNLTAYTQRIAQRPAVQKAMRAEGLLK